MVSVILHQRPDKGGIKSHIGVMEKADQIINHRSHAGILEIYNHNLPSGF